MIVSEHKTATNSSGIVLHFDEKAHKYYTDAVSDFVSGTAFIHNFFPEFDEKRISEITAKRRGISVEEVLEEWRLSRELGNEVHYYSECIVQGKTPPRPSCARAQNMCKHIDEYIPKMLERFDLIEAEKIVFSEKLKLAGTMDLLLQHKKNKKYYVIDWKTVNKMRLRSFRNAKGFGVCSHIDDSNYWHYSIQVNLYLRKQE